MLHRTTHSPEDLEQAMGRDTQMRQVQVQRATFATRLARLTWREREVLDLMLVGLLNKEIALCLAISQCTVELHCGRCMQKLHAASIVYLARLVFWGA